METGFVELEFLFEVMSTASVIVVVVVFDVSESAEVFLWDIAVGLSFVAVVAVFYYSVGHKLH